MGDKSKIEWTDATWNPVTGCSKVSQGCKFCYAERVFPRPYPGREFTDVRCHPERLEQPLKWKKPRRIFVNSMSDLFHEKVTTDFILQVYVTMLHADQHVFQILTKRPERMLRFFRDLQKSVTDWPLRNAWLGVSVEDQKTADERIPILLQTPAAVRFVSYEPALGPVDFSRWLPIQTVGGVEMETWLDWIIAGGESGPHARPAHPDWFRQVRDQCQAAGVPFFLKQWGEWGPQGQILNCSARKSLCSRRYNWNKPRTDIPLESDCRVSFRVGKKAAGRLLDGREWNEFPEVKR